MKADPIASEFWVGFSPPAHRELDPSVNHKASEAELQVAKKALNTLKLELSEHKQKLQQSKEEARAVLIYPRYHNRKRHCDCTLIVDLLKTA